MFLIENIPPMPLLRQPFRRCQQFGELGFEQCFIRLRTPTEADGAFDLFRGDAHGGQNVARSVALRRACRAVGDGAVVPCGDHQGFCGDAV